MTGQQVSPNHFIERTAKSTLPGLSFAVHVER
jgi:hypothetical protein